MLFEKRRALDWAALEPNKFAQGYMRKDFMTLRNYLEHRMRNDTIRLLRRLELSESVFFQVRQKKSANLINKIIKIGKKLAAGEEVMLSSRTNEKVELAREYHLHELVKDIIGIRYICLDSATLETLLSVVLRSESLKIRDLEIYRPFF